MLFKETTSRRTLFKTGFAALASGVLSPVFVNAFTFPHDNPEETRVLFFGGTGGCTNIYMLENCWRRVLGRAGWRLMFAQSSQFVTSEVLSKADLFIPTKNEGFDTVGFSPDGIVEERPLRYPWMTEEQENAIVENVYRGMGLIVMHCSIWNPNNTKFLELIGAKKPIMHGPVQPVHIHDINQNHPITKGISEFDIPHDENFGSELMEECTLLYKSIGQQDKRTDNAAWCLERGKGRIVVLLAGHQIDPYCLVQFKKIMWRSAHWVLKREIPEMEFKQG